MTCPACERAERDPNHGRYLSGCLHCSARLIANGQTFWQSKKAEDLQPAYRQLLAHTFGEDWQRWHAEVKRWAQRIERLRKREREPS